MRKIFTLSAITLALALTGCNDSSHTSKTPDIKESLPKFVSTPRSSVNINEGWTYQMNYSDIVATLPDFDDSGAEWESVDLPHSVDAGNVVNADPNSPHFKGMNTYRKNLSIKKEQGKRQYLEFDGSAMITTVYVNGQKAGEHTGGFMRFRIDITDHVIDGENTIAIQVDNRPYDPKVHQTAFLPMETGQDYTYYGGIYRDVKLVQVGEIGFDAEDYGSSGVYFMQTNTTENASELYSNIRIRNKSKDDFNGNIRTIIQDASGKTVYSQLTSATVIANDVTEVENEFTLDNIHLWDGVKDPYLYRIFVQVFDGNKLVDQVEQPLGLRYFSFDADKGFMLNGNEYRLNGVAMHQDRDIVGWSTNKDMRNGDLDLVREMGATSIRFSHYPHALDTGEYSNQIGLMNYLELPIVNSYLTETEHGASGAQYLESAKEQMRALIRQNFNFPSMALVGNSNEIGLAMPNSAENTEWLQALSDVIKDEFGQRFGKTVPYRKTTQATVLVDQIGDKDWDTVEMPCHNRYFGWYVGKIDDVGTFIDDIKTAYPDLPFCMSEYGAGVSTLPEYASEIPQMADHSSQWGNKYHEGYLKAYNERPWVWGTYVWNMFDFSVATRDEGDTIGRNDKGLVKFDHVTKKDQFYFYQANWAEAPMIQLVDKNISEGSSRGVKVYSTLDEVTLFVNGQQVSTKKRSDNDKSLPGVFEWVSTDIDSNFKAEQRNYIEVSGVKNNQKFTDSFDRFVKEYAGTSIYSDQVAIISTEDKTNNLFTGTVSHLPENMTFEELKKLVTLDLGAQWGNSSSSSVLVDGDTFVIIAGNGDSRTYTVKETSSLSTYRDAYSSLLYQFTSPGATDADMFDGSLATTPVGMAGFNPASVNATISVDLGAIFYVDHVEPIRNPGIEQASGNASYTFQINGDILGTDKVPYTDPIVWTNQVIKLNNGPQALKRLELKLTDTKWVNQVPLVGFSEINVYGGLIKGDLLGLDYKARTFNLDVGITDIDALNQAITQIDSLSIVTDKVSVELLDNTDQTVNNLSVVTKIKVSQTRGGLVYTEIYTKL
ncbi:glycoside hydrolase family 2 protein [Photobacterium sagamiensis]|uniref:glycoside hydrolase family 2 protein n=1 Tax=Photobacterium sagamiensis TaxID=2910241 RepID=UPI003D0F5EE5